MTHEERDQDKASGTTPGEALREAATRTSPPGRSDTDEQAKQTSEDGLEQAGGGH